eukprot:TRINITY_DN2497_c0_g1_i1.p1 TRINITY_DN2497_c0_g1~~TRINITY_DN2497_c0_g1_i1.p1  ORF type:complete len:284 (+),score=74.06 TRINITY_DN2497_c0_g1_i1:58-909(+)
MGKVRIRVIGAKDLLAADAGGTSDPYVNITVGQSKQKTKVVKRNLNPSWNETFTFNCHPTDHVLFQIMDWDRFGKDDCIGQANVEFDILIQGLEFHQFLNLTGGKGAIEVSIIAEDFTGPRAQQQQQQQFHPPQQQFHPPQQQYHPPPQQFHPPPQQHFQQPPPQQYHPPQQQHQPPQQFGSGQHQPIIGPNGRPVRRPHGITDQEILSIMEKFRQVDTDRSGTIDHRELKPLLRMTCQTTMSDALLDRFVNLQMQSVDANRSGSIDFDEFLTLYTKFKQGGV